MSKERILIIEDDRHISKLVDYNLKKSGFECFVAKNGEEGFKIMEEQPIDLIILDIMLPDLDGFEVCKKIKQNNKFISTPIIMLTAKGEEIDRIVGLQLGADDYVVKPFSPRELILRIKAILRRGKQPEDHREILIAEKLKIDIPKHEVSVDKKNIKLTLMEFKLLVMLVQKKEKVLSRDRLLDDIWDIAADIDTRTVDTHIKRLRQKLGKTGKLIKTVRGIGYKFSEEK